MVRPNVVEEPPSTHLLFEGIRPEEITANFLLGVHDLADERGLAVEGISVSHDDRDR